MRHVRAASLVCKADHRNQSANVGYVRSSDSCRSRERTGAAKGSNVGWHRGICARGRMSALGRKPTPTSIDLDDWNADRAVVAIAF